MNFTTQISLCLNSAIDINKQLGGTRGYQSETKNKDQFIVVRDRIYKQLHAIEQKIDQRLKKRGTELTLINAQIKNMYKEVRRSLDQLESIINNQRNKQSTKDIKLEIYSKMKQQINKLQAIIEDGEDSQKNMGKISKFNVATLTDEKAMPLFDGNNTDSIYSDRTKPNHNQPRNAPINIQLQAMQRYKKNDQLIDARLDTINDRLQDWKKDINKIGKLIDQTDDRTKTLTKQVQKVTDNLSSSNKKLKGIVEKYRKPHRVCLDVILVIILLGLIAAIVKLALE